MLTILLVDNHPISLESLDHFLKSRFKEASIITCTNVHDARENGEYPKLDFIILGINEPTTKETLNIVQLCRSSFSSVPLIINDHCAQPQNFLSYLKLGVKGCLLKENPAEEIVICIEKVLQGRYFLTSMAVDVLINKTVAGPENRERIRQKGLTPRENEIARYLSNGNGNTWISNKLNIKPSTVSTIKKNVFVKMKVSNVIELRELMQST